LVVVAAADQLAVTLTPQVARRVGGVKYSLDELLDQSTAGDVASGRAFHVMSPGDVISGLTFFSSMPPKTSTAHARLSTFFLPSTGCSSATGGGGVAATKLATGN